MDWFGEVLGWLNPIKWVDTITNTVFQSKNYEEQKETNDENYELAKLNSERNYQLQRETLDYQKELQHKIFDREDTATQRKKADLIAAGMNPLLAAGSGAGAGSVVPVITPQHQTPVRQASLYPDGIGQGISRTIDEMFQNMKTGAEIDKIKADASFQKQNEKKIQAETKNIEQNLFNLKADFDLKNLDKQLKSVGYDISLEQLKGLTIGNAISQVDLNTKTMLEQFALKTGLPASLITPEMGFASLIAQTVGNATSDIFNAVAPIMEKIPLVGAIWNSVSDNEKVQALNSVLGLVSAVFGLNLAKITMQNGKAVKTKVDETTTQTKRLPDGTILKQEVKTKN